MLKELKTSADVSESEPQEHSEDVAKAEPQEQEREERVDCGVTFYYDDGSSYSREFRFTSKGIVFNLHRDHISFDDPQHDSSTVFNVFNLPNAEKIVTIDLSFLPCDDEDDELPF